MHIHMHTYTQAPTCMLSCKHCHPTGSCTDRIMTGAIQFLKATRFRVFPRFTICIVEVATRLAGRLLRLFHVATLEVSEALLSSLGLGV